MVAGESEFARRCQCAEIDLGSIAVRDVVNVNVYRWCNNCDLNYLTAFSLFVPRHVAFEVSILQDLGATVRNQAGKVWSGLAFQGPSELS